MKKVYFSGSIQGHLVSTQDFLYSIRDYLENKGLHILDPHVFEIDKDKRYEVFKRASGRDPKQHPDPPALAKEIDFAWLNEADIVIAVVDGNGSHGVGMELQRAIDKPDLGLNNTYILCLREKGTEDRLSWMIKGERTNLFRLEYYENLADCLILIDKFLSSIRIN